MWSDNRLTLPTIAKDGAAIGAAFPQEACLVRPQRAVIPGWNFIVS